MTTSLFLRDAEVLALLLKHGARDRLSPRRIGQAKYASIGHAVDADEQRINLPYDIVSLPLTKSRTHGDFGGPATAAQNGEHD
jgi:hypothetical protein